MQRLSGLVASIALALAALHGCGGGDLILPSDGTPAELRITDGDKQAGSPRAALADSLEVSVLDARGEPLPGQTVEFVLESQVPGAAVSPVTARTRANGAARALWVVGEASGTQTVLARVERDDADPLEAQFSATVAPSAASRMAVADGNGQSAPAGSQLPNPLVVLVTDDFGNPVAGVPVEWAAEAGKVDPVSSTTEDDGRASTMWTLGSATGSQAVTASSGSLDGSPATFTAQAQPGSPEDLTGVSGNGQSAAPGSELPNPLVVRLVDERGNGVPNRPVSWVVATGGGSVSPATSTTDSDGRASTRWTIGAGSNTLNAVVSGVGVVGFTATGTSGGGGGGGGGGVVASRLEFRVQPSDTEERETMSPSVQVAVLDVNGNLVTDREFPIKLELIDDRGRVRADGTVRTRSGVATFTIRINRDGEYRLRASTDGLPSVESDRFEVEDD
jgi:Bacterial Ig-like domain (group 1)